MSQIKTSSSIRRSKERMYPLIESYLSQGESQADFCSIHQIKLCTFQYWLSKYRKESRRESDSRPVFTPLEVVDNSYDDYALEFRDSSGHELRFRQLPPVKYLKALLC